MSDDGSEWIVIIRVPDSADNPHMSIYQDQTRFMIRVGNRKRAMTYDDPDPTALELIKELYFAFGYDRKHIPFFDATGHCRL